MAGSLSAMAVIIPRSTTTTAMARSAMSRPLPASPTPAKAAAWSISITTTTETSTRVIVNYAATPILYRNNGENSGHWLRVKTEGTRSNRDGIGAFITLLADATHPDQLQVREIGSGDSYLSQSELTAQFGLGSLSQTIDLVEVDWPASGLVQRYVNVPIDTLLMARERLLGDFNGDGIVDAADYTVWRDSFGMTGAGLAADGAGPNGLPDGIGRRARLSLLESKLRRVVFIASGAAAIAGSSSQSVPEPTFMNLLLQCGGVACLGLVWRRLGVFT